ncbi:hypothetical protein B0H34DRAFT_743495 [Crassisporium funariophilum]|nr:hypothetical protein B0H34DRAFT_743495 [Crassisporium funariophilum]
MKVHHCSCGELAYRRCAGCRVPWYCSRTCQKASWTRHVFDCNVKRAITTADRLALACLQDTFPTHEETLIDYGFKRALTRDNQSKILGLFIGMLNYGEFTGIDIKASMVHRWRTTGKLVEEIKAYFTKLPVNSRGGYYAWFLKNQWVFDQKQVTESEELARAMKMKAAWGYSERSPSSKIWEIAKTVSKWTPPEQDCFEMCGTLLCDFQPIPADRLWITFGLCTCRDDTEAMFLGNLYRTLLQYCTWEEFCTAYTSSSLTDLFKSKGLADHKDNGYTHYDRFNRFKMLDSVLAMSPLCNQSVWDLKQFIILDSDECQTPSVVVDYGFMNCRDKDETHDLKAAYKTFFGVRDANPTALHNACVEGRIFEYVSGLVNLKKQRKKFQRLMKNPYPLPTEETF